MANRGLQLQAIANEQGNGAALGARGPRFLEGLTPNTLRAIVAAAKHLSFRAGKQIIEEGEPSKRLVMLTSGRCRHFVLTSRGQRFSFTG